METLYIIFAAFTLLLVPAAFSIYDVYFQKWVKALPQSEERERYSQIFHAVKFWAMTLATLAALFWIYKTFSLAGIIDFHYTVLLKWLPLCMAVYWITFDAYWNIKNNMPWFYPGDGKGGFIEIAVKSITVGLNNLSKWINSKLFFWPRRPFDFTGVMFMARLVGLTAGILIIKYL